MNPYKDAADHLYALADIFNELGAQSASGPARPARPEATVPKAAPASFSDGTPIDEPPFEELSPFDQPEPKRASAEAVLSECPVHFQPWSVREGGISRNGKPYKAFWKCNGKNQDGSYCSKKPDPSWVKAHPPERALTAA